MYSLNISTKHFIFAKLSVIFSLKKYRECLLPLLSLPKQIWQPKFFMQKFKLHCMNEQMHDVKLNLIKLSNIQSICIIYFGNWVRSTF